MWIYYCLCVESSKHSQRRIQKPKADGAQEGAQVTRALPVKAIYLLYGKGNTCIALRCQFFLHSL